jgi:hypothetical protein
MPGLPRGSGDEPGGQFDALISARVAPPYDQQLEGGDSVGAGLLRVHPLVQVGVGDDAARLVECVRGEDEAQSAGSSRSATTRS